MSRLFQALFDGNEKHCCRVCGKECDSRRESEEHADIPVAKQIFPLGLVFKCSFPDVEIYHEIVCLSRPDWHHEPFYELMHASNDYRIGEGRIIIQEELLQELKNGNYCFLSPKEFSEFPIIYEASIRRLRQKHGITALIRSVEIPKA